MVLAAFIPGLFATVAETLRNTPRLTWAAIGAGLLAAALLFRLFFEDLDEFVTGLQNFGRRARLSASTDDRWSGLKFTIWLMLSAAAGWAAYFHLAQWFPGYFQ